jgi:hypothetical protein
MDYWQQLIAVIVTPVLVVGAVAWLLRKFFERGFQRDLEMYKSELARANHEHQTKFSLIHQKRADVIADLYGRLAKAKGLLGDLVGLFQPGGQSLPDKKKKVADAYNEASSFFFQHRLFIPESTAVKVEQVLDAMREAFYSFDTAQMGHDEYKPDQTGLWVEAHKAVRDKLPPLLGELEEQFREAIGGIEKSH